MFEIEKPVTTQAGIKQAKQALRKEIKMRKADFFESYSSEEQVALSAHVLNRVEALPEFQRAKVVLAYYSLPDELYTHDAVARWAKSKTILLPKVVGDNLTLHRYCGLESMHKGAFGIMEPATPQFCDYQSIDLVIVPGVAFDKKCNRLGRGRGYYDKLFANLLPAKVAKVGVCYPFQIVDKVPAEDCDMQMDNVLSI